MKRLHTMLLLALTGCGKVHKMGGNSGYGGNWEEILINEAVGADQQPNVTQTFTTSEGHSIAFVLEGGNWVAIVDEKLPSGFIHKVKLPICFEEGFSVDILLSYNQERQRHLIHITRTSDGQYIVYVGKLGLQGGGLGQSVEKTPNYEFWKKATLCGGYKCFQCEYSYKGFIKSVQDSFGAHFCNKEGCESCLRLKQNQCTCHYSITNKRCKQCCSCNQKRFSIW